MAISRSRRSLSSSGKPKPAPPASAGRLACRGHSISYEVHGPEGGPAVVLLHHGLGSVRAWKSQIPALAAAGFRVLAYDRWGYGGSDPRPALDLPGFGADLGDLEALLDAQGVSRAALIGHSDGGTMALYFAARSQGRVSALVTVAGHIYVEPSRLPAMISLGQEYESDPELREKLRRAHGEKADRVFHNWFDGWVDPRHLGWDMRPLLGQVRCPSLVVQGEGDEHASPQHARDLASSLPNASLWLIPGVRHFPPQEAPEDFNHRVIEFLRESWRGERAVEAKAVGGR